MSPYVAMTVACKLENWVYGDNAYDYNICTVISNVCIERLDASRVAAFREDSRLLLHMSLSQQMAFNCVDF